MARRLGAALNSVLGVWEAPDHSVLIAD